jgi:hypothetical protein
MEGEVWVAAGSNLYHSKSSGANATKVTGPSQLYSVGFGKAATGASYPAVYIVGTVGGVSGVFRSTDQGVTWLRVNDDQHQYGQMDNVAGDEDYFGRVFVTTQGRGIPYGQPATATGGSTGGSTGATGGSTGATGGSTGGLGGSGGSRGGTTANGTGGSTGGRGGTTGAMGGATAGAGGSALGGTTAIMGGTTTAAGGSTGAGGGVAGTTTAAGGSAVAGGEVAGTTAAAGGSTGGGGEVATGGSTTGGIGGDTGGVSSTSAGGTTAAVVGSKSPNGNGGCSYAPVSSRNGSRLGVLTLLALLAIRRRRCR